MHPDVQPVSAAGSRRCRNRPAATSLAVTMMLAFSLLSGNAVQAADLYIHSGGGGGGAPAATTGGGGGGGFIGNTDTRSGNGGTTAGLGNNGGGGNGVGTNVVGTYNGQPNGTPGPGGGGAQAGGAGLPNGNGGAGGDATVLNDATTSYGVLSVRSGQAGSGGDVGAGGAGGNTTYTRDATPLEITAAGNSLYIESGIGGASSFAGPGGTGGNTVFDAAGDITVTAGNVRIWAETAGNEPGGGAGGDVDVSIGGKLTTVAGTLEVFGGIGSDIGGDGKGGDTTVMAGSLDIAGAANLRGGASTNNGPAGLMSMTLTDSSETSVFHDALTLTGTNGRSLGAGGDATLDASGVNVTVEGNLAIASGNGAATGTAGVGGNAVLRANTLTLGGAASTVQSGTAGAVAPGSVTVAVTTLTAADGSAASLQVTKQAGPVDFTAGSVQATAGGLTLGFTDTDVTDDDTVTLGSLLVGNGQTLVVNAPANTMTLTGGLQTNGYDAANPDLLAPSTYTATGPAATNFTGKPLGFAFPLAIASNATVLTTTNPLTLDNTTQVSLSPTGSGPLQLADGDRIVLASNIGGSFYPSRNVTAGGYTFEVLSDGGQLIAIFRGRAAGSGQMNDIPVNPVWMLLMMSMAILWQVGRREKTRR